MVFKRRSYEPVFKNRFKNSKYGLFFLTAILAAGQNRQGTIKTDLNPSSSGNLLLSFK
jgi:hypothetical protein